VLRSARSIDDRGCGRFCDSSPQTCGRAARPRGPLCTPASIRARRSRCARKAGGTRSTSTGKRTSPRRAACGAGAEIRQAGRGGAMCGGARRASWRPVFVRHAESARTARNQGPRWRARRGACRARSASTCARRTAITRLSVGCACCRCVGWSRSATACYRIRQGGAARSCVITRTRRPPAVVSGAGGRGRRREAAKPRRKRASARRLSAA